MTTPPDSCRAQPLGYLVWLSDAHRRHAAGQRQVWCRTCALWKWHDQVCSSAETISAAQFRQRAKAYREIHP